MSLEVCMTSRATFSCFLFLALLLACASLLGQGLTGQISGTVTDPSAAAIANAAVRLMNTVTGQTRSTITNDEGRFVFPELLPGTFSLTVEAPGFKKYEHTEITVSATERVTLPLIALQ